jgi:hypothetical protein
MLASPGVRVAFREVGLTLMISGDRLVRVADADAIAKHTHATATHHRSRATPTEFRPLSKGIGPFLLRSVSRSNFPSGEWQSPLQMHCALLDFVEEVAHGRKSSRVFAASSVDRDYSDRSLYDTEETKSTGAMNRLIAEKNNPQADVYWANEASRMFRPRLPGRRHCV